MSERGEIWVHGNSVVVQYPGGEPSSSPFMPGHRMMYAEDPEHTSPGVPNVPWSDLLGIRTVKGATFRGSWGIPGSPTGPTTNWFHFSLPTPAIVPQLDVTKNLGITVDHISVYYKTPEHGNITIRKIAVTDGAVTHYVSDLERFAYQFSA
jgi:hypothetical protein